MSLLEIIGLSHSFGMASLFREAALTLNRGEHVGVVGQNGAGKSTLLKICTEQVVPDAGRVVWQPRVTFGCLDQYAKLERAMTVKTFLQSAYAALYAVAERMDEQYAMAADGDHEALDRAAVYQQQLEAGDFYAIDTNIERVATGLGLAAMGLDRPLGEMSGGQRAKVILAKLLLQKPDVLLLDEPTNFLDKEHIAWLGHTLAELESAFLVVSHDVAFLDKIATRIVDVEGEKIAKYHGTYSEFLRKKTLLREDYVRQYTAQQREIKRTEEFIRRNIAGRKTRMAQGRRKQLERMDRLEAVEQRDVKPDFRFEAIPVAAAEHLVVRRLLVGYYYPILPPISFAVKGGQKVVVTGFNGIGKSTLIKTLVGQIQKLDGAFAIAGQGKPGYFEQEWSWEDSALTPLQIVLNAHPSLSAKEARQRLFRCGIGSKHAMQSIGTLSGGEQAKVKLCLLSIRPCNFLILDEPTNHLDRLAKEALQTALRQFPGTVLLVSHEEAFYRDWTDRVIDVSNWKRS